MNYLKHYVSAKIIDTATFKKSDLNSFVRSTLNSSSDNQIDFSRFQHLLTVRISGMLSTNYKDG